MNIKQAISKVAGFEDLSERETAEVFDAIMSGKATASQIAAFITALRMKGETVDEITGAAKVMRKKSLKIRAGVKGRVLLDTCGTGGSGKDIFNVSTASAFVTAACGVKVAKHGNRAVSSKCGSADVLEALGVGITAPRKTVERCIREINIGFLFAPACHSAMKYAAAPRKEAGLRTIFNVLGPLSNPASAGYQVMGVYSPGLTDTMAKVLARLGSKRAYVVHGMDGLDEVTITGRTKVSELRSGRVRTYFISPADFGIKVSSLAGIKGGSPAKNASIIKGVLSGKKGPARDIVIMNAALALVASGKAAGLKAGAGMAARAIDSGKAMEKLHELVKMTRGKR